MKKIGDVAAALLPKWESCGNCRSGWIPSKPIDGRPEQYLIRCPCFVAHQKRVADTLKREKDKA